jgi:hypothetical protein
MESMPVWLANIMNVISPTPHFVVFAQDVLYRGAGISIVWLEVLATIVIGSVYRSVPLAPRHLQRLRSLRRKNRRDLLIHVKTRVINPF